MNLLPPLLGWALKSASMFNTILLVWLGLTVLLNAERRAWGIWLAGCGLLLGGAFFAGQTVTLDYQIEDMVLQLRLWWYPAWLCVIALPLGWYVLMLWYAGFWEFPTPARSALASHRARLTALLLAAALLFALLWFVNPFRVIRQMAHLEQARAVSGWPLLVMAYPPFVFGCLLSSIGALRRPGPSARMMGDVARRRARPYLIASSLLLLAVSLLVAGVLAWAVTQLFREGIEGLADALMLTIDAIDFLASGLIALAVVLLGKAIVSYEIFTGKTLPRRGFLRQWRSFVSLAAAYSVLVSLAWTLPLRPVYALLLTTMLLAVSYALFSWRSSVEREDFIDHLRPFVASQHLYEHLLQREDTRPEMADEARAQGQFRALCEGFLNAQSAHLIPLGPLAMLAPTPLSHGSGEAPAAGALRGIAARFGSPRLACLAVEPEAFGGASWAVPLWGERGVIGVLLLGPRRGGGLYAQEEIEIARASGERLLDAQAGTAMAGRLMNLQRRRLAESQIIDRRARRVLHDDILPQLHTAMLQLSVSSEEKVQQGVQQLGEVHRAIAEVLREMPLSTTPEWRRRGLAHSLREMAEHEFGAAFDSIEWSIEDRAHERARALPPLTGETLFYAAREAIRNAARYARASSPSHPSPGTTQPAGTSTCSTQSEGSTENSGSGERPLRLRVAISGAQGLLIEIEDDGIGLPSSGLAPSMGGESNGGSGSGLALHSTLLAVVGGSLSIESEPGRFTRVSIALPDSATLAAPAIREGE